MKRAALILLLIVLVAGGIAAQEWLAPPEIDGEAVYIPFPVDITMDGDLSDWANIQPIIVTRGPYTSGDPTDNGLFTFGLAADHENLYIYMIMPDKNIISGQHGANYWNEDSLEFYLNLSGDRSTTSYIDGVFQINIKPLDIGNPDLQALNITGTSSENIPVSGHVFNTEDGWGFEGAISLAEAGVTPEHGLEIGFQAQANGATTQDRDSKLIWSLVDTEDNSWQDPSLFGAGLFFEVGSDDVPQPTNLSEESETESVMPANLSIRTNQTGYFPTAAKYAVRVAAEGESANWSLVDAESGEPVLKGTTTAAQWDEASGDYVQGVDFSEWAEAGEYKLVIGEDESAPFAITNNLYSQLAVDALRYFYLNRSGIELTEEFAGEWARPAGHLTDAEITCFKGVDASGRNWPGCDYVFDGSMGWYDAGDYGKYVVNGGITVWTLLNLYERFPEAFPDGALNIPESGNGVPDLLDEVRWEMEWMLRMQVPEGDPLAGMVFHKLHDETWSGIPILPAAEYDNDNANANPGAGRYVYQPTTSATLNLAATAAQCARVWETIDPDFAAQCLTAAETAWTATQENDILYAGNTPGSGGGNYEDRQLNDEFFWAAAELYITTQDAAYLDFVEQYGQRTPLPGPELGNSSSMTWGATAALGIISLAMVDGNEAYQQQIIQAADSYLAVLEREGYRLPMNINGYVWGSNSVVLNNGIILALAYDFTGNEAYLNGVVAVMDYLLGRNALSFSFVAGYGVEAVQHVHHRFWANQGDYPPPPPGALAGGPNAQPSDEDALANANLESGPAKRYVDMIGSFSTNEVAINWNSPLVWVAAYLDQHFAGE